MSITDTSEDALRFQIQLYREMTVEKKASLVFSAYQTGKQLAMAGIRIRQPQAGEEQIWHIWARQHLGDELYAQAYGNSADG